ncbi:uroporphyrinogen decarboxylase [Microbacterium sp. MPKO10]|uniref:uroporphyrinogen decarboxylase n=1 Tax=Microbacterium sp. MPKO10 TaxID=2989818 RepID=UPI002235F694|nr:uroporphyrinogen decarboxylase [Microbacterium sp. MPKO10]MCW4457096.1 uroporphyrinogen decarboxylase [Microbacterium sp. MPKO10]
MHLDSGHPLAAGLTHDSRLIRAYRGDRPSTTPVWFMRQAGRSLPEYRELRAGTAMLDACLTPGMASEITLQPVRRHHVDAAVFFSDIVVPLKLAGVDVEIVPGTGPVMAHPVRTNDELDALVALDPAVLDEALAPVIEAVRLTVAQLEHIPGTPGPTPLVGFAGAPFTLAAYLIEGGPSKDHMRARALMHSDPVAWSRLMAWCADVTGRFLRAQVLAGASAAQLFDSWAGSLALTDYSDSVAPASARTLEYVHDITYERDGQTHRVPVVHFGVGTGDLLTVMHEVGADTVGIDYRTPLDVASERLGGAVPLQGNIDPAMLFAPWSTLEEHVLDVLRRGESAPAHVLNLGHGVPPDADAEVLTRLVELVHSR